MKDNFFYTCIMNMGKRKYRMVLDNKTNFYIIEKKIDLILFNYWSRNYLRDKKTNCYQTEEPFLARKIVNILNGTIVK